MCAQVEWLKDAMKIDTIGAVKPALNAAQKSTWVKSHAPAIADEEQQAHLSLISHAAVNTVRVFFIPTCTVLTRKFCRNAPAYAHAGPLPAAASAQVAALRWQAALRPSCGRSYYEMLVQLLRPGGLLVVDNTLWYGNVAKPEDTSEQTQALRACNKHIARYLLPVKNHTRIDITRDHMSERPPGRCQLGLLGGIVIAVDPENTI